MTLIYSKKDEHGDWKQVSEEVADRDAAWERVKVLEAEFGEYHVGFFRVVP